MRLAPGTRLGPYEVESAVGAGGMGEVYKARDTRLERAVAIKVLPQHLSSSSDLRARLEREARSISSLQHPNICVLHDVGHDPESGTDFLVMEFLEGETLAKRLAKGPLPIEQVLKAAVEIADALDKAHKQGLIHRDLKPGNVMLTKSGAKLMDFGLAKPQMMSAGVSTAGVPAFTAATASSPATPLTAAGSIIGTYQYMSPEQIEGKEADARSDIFAFGALLYEMTTGRRAFEGKSQLSVASAILEKEPEPISSIQPLVPPALSRVVSTCLEKDPEKRFQTAHDLKLQLQWISEAGSQAGLPALVVSRRKVQRNVLWAAAAGLALVASALAGVALYYRAQVRAAELPLRVEVLLSGERAPTSTELGAALLAPDGSRLVVVVVSGNNTALVVRDLATGQTIDLSGTEGATFPFWSPDGRSIGFFANGKVKHVPANGGPVQIVCDAPDGRGGAWSEKGVIIFAPNIREPLFKVADGGGTPEPITKPPGPMWTHRNPYFLPGGDAFLYTARDTSLTSGQGRLEAARLSGGASVVVIEKASNAQYSGGHLFYVRNRNLVAHAFDLDNLRLQGNALPLAQGVEFFEARDVGNFSVAGGTLVYRISPLPRARITWMDRMGREQGTIGDVGYFTGLRLSPDNRRAIVNQTDSNGENGDVWLVDFDRNTFSRSTFAASPQFLSAAFSPDSSRLIVSTATAFTTGKIWMQSPTGTGSQEELTGSTDLFFIHDWSLDGKFVVGGVQDSKRGMDLVAIPMAGDRKPVPVIQTPFWEWNARISPNGKWLAYESSESGQFEIYVTAFPGGGQKFQISSGGGFAARWAGNGRELFFVSGGRLKVLPIRDPESFSFAPAQDLFNGDELGVLDYEVSTDGRRLLALRRVGQSASRSFNLTLNWQHLVATR